MDALKIKKQQTHLRQTLINNGICSFFHLSAKADSSNHKGWQFNKKTKSLLAVAIIFIMLISFFVFLSGRSQDIPIAPQISDPPLVNQDDPPQGNNTVTNTNSHVVPIQLSPVAHITENARTGYAPSHDSGVFESAQTIDNSVWWLVAVNAWQYFSPGVGVDRTTGLPWAGKFFSYFTSWDLGVYIQAVLDAGAIGLIGEDGDWGSSARLERVMSFLENRDLNDYGYPYWFYQSGDGKEYAATSGQGEVPVDLMDTGRLFVALNNLKLYNSSLAPRIDALVTGPGNRSDFAALVPSVKNESLTSTSIYMYYVACGFASFWPDELGDAPNNILNNMFAGENVTTYEVTLPVSGLVCDPLLCSVFETPDNPQLMALADQVYLAHEAYYNATGQYRAFSEGGTASDAWAYEWVVYPDGRTWTVQYVNGEDLGIIPVIYTKVAVGFLSLYDTSFAKDMTVFLEQTLPEPTSGYCEGVDENDAPIAGIGIITNGLILGAANYAIYDAMDNSATP